MSYWFHNPIKLLATLLAFLGGAEAAVTSKCLVCEKVGFAATEADAIEAFANAAGGNNDLCLNGANDNTDGVANSDATYCVAQFFIYHAKDMDINSKGWVVLTG